MTTPQPFDEYDIIFAGGTSHGGHPLANLTICLPIQAEPPQA